MNLKSCESCGVVIDLDQLRYVIENLIDQAQNYDGSYNTNIAEWDSDKEQFIVKINCPVCHEHINTGEKV